MANDQLTFPGEEPPAPRSPELERAWLRLAFLGLPAARSRLVLGHWSDPVALFAAVDNGRESELLATPGITPSTVERLRELARLDLKRAVAAMETHGIRLLLEGDADYPVSLRGIPDPPPYLFIVGTVESRDEIAVAIVGTRHATEYGRGIAEKLSIDLANRGVTVVSGLARGIDAAAHRGALDAGGRTFAVCGCGLDVVYPSDHKTLLREATLHGAAFSEFAPTVAPQAWHFPARNRIISGLSVGTIVIEAGERSGALITADFALDQGREVFAVPGNIHKAQSRGCHALIKQGATLIESADDVIAALNNRTLPFSAEPLASRRMEPVVPHAPSVRADLNPIENRIYLGLDVEPRHVDDLAAAAGLGVAEVNATLVMLELKGVARRLAGGLFALVT